MIRFVTGFETQLFKATGEAMVRSFLRVDAENELVIAHEIGSPARGGGPSLVEVVPADLRNHERLTWIDLAEDQLLKEWDGGWRKRCERSEDYMNRRAWQWYRKSAALRLTHQLDEDDHEADWIVWVDCDCVFQLTLTAEALDKWAGNPKIDLLYLRGERDWSETGIVAYRGNSQGRFILHDFIGFYESGMFYNQERWDDCWILDTVIRMDWRRCKDLGGPNPGTKGCYDVVATSPFASFITHNKGVHKKLGKEWQMNEEERRRQESINPLSERERRRRTLVNLGHQMDPQENPKPIRGGKAVLDKLMDESEALIDADVLLKECLDELPSSELSNRVERFLKKLDGLWS